MIFYRSYSVCHADIGVNLYLTKFILFIAKPKRKIAYDSKWSFILWQKREAPPGEKPEPVRTHLRNMIIVPEMIGSIIGVYNGKTFNQVEIKPEMIGHYLAEFSISYKPVKHGRPGIGATHSSRFIPLKWRLHICLDFLEGWTFALRELLI